MSNSIQNPFELLNVKLPYPLCVVEDRYGGVYSGAYFLAFNMFPFELDRLLLMLEMVIACILGKMKLTNISLVKAKHQRKLYGI